MQVFRRVLAIVSATSLALAILVTPASAASKITFDNLDIKRVRQAAYAQINKAFATAPAVKSNMTFLPGPSVSESRLGKEKAALLRAERFWADLFKPTKIYAAHYTEADVDWVDSAYCSQANYCQPGRTSISELIKSDSNQCNGAFASRTSDGVPFFAQCLGKGSDVPKTVHVGAHEYFHLVQQEYVDFGNAPIWFIEGSADYFGDAVAAWNGKTLPTIMDKLQNESAYAWVNQDWCPLNQRTIADVVRCFKFTENRNGAQPENSHWVLAHAAYYMGSQATEAMIAVKGLNVFKAFLKDLKGKDFATVFANHYGLTLDKFYPKVAKYVLAMYKAKK